MILSAVVEFLKSVDQSPTFWGCAGGLVATYLKYRERDYRPYNERPSSNPVGEYFANAVLGGFLTHLYAVSGSVLTPLTACVSGGSAPILLKQVLNATPQHPPGSREPAT